VGGRDGTIVSGGPDHTPHTVEQKRQDLATAPAGAVGVETLAPLTVNEALTGRLSPERLSCVLSEGTARLYGLYPKKGAILSGADADLTIVDREGKSVIENERLHSKHPISSWDRLRLRRALKAGVVRGNAVMRDGEPAGEPRGHLVWPVRVPVRRWARLDRRGSLEDLAKGRAVRALARRRGGRGRGREPRERRNP
jgi:dihydroorotase-like cyclic amidohydrolase